MSKCKREGYDEAPFFYVEAGSETPYAVAWLPGRLEELVTGLLRHWPRRLDVHVEVLDEDFEEVEFDAFGDIGREKLLKVLAAHAETAFGDGGVRFRIWRRETDKEHCLGLDEHGVLHVWEEPEQVRAWLKGAGIEERRAELVDDDEHWHETPEDSDLKRERFLDALQLKSS
ncbi:MAG: hypothetical protein AAGD14_08850 [Planctomycetota bacterium]